jgi:predicted TIM-barrel fold metal-dependent hydrolase
MEMHVDTHVHVISEDEKQYPLNPSHATGPWYREDPCSVERLMTLMDDAAVDAAVLVQAISAYQHDNRYCAESARRFPERFTSVACTDLAAADAAEEARRVVNDDHMRGMRWVAIRDGGVGEPRAVWDAIGELKVPVVVTILADRLEELAAAAPTLPPVPIALDHCAFADFSHGVPEALAALAAFPRVHLKVSSNALDLMAAHGDPAEMVEELAARFGADHLMWGSDYSQTHDRPYAELVEWGRKATAKLSDDDRAWFLGGTAVSMWPELAR